MKLKGEYFEQIKIGVKMYEERIALKWVKRLEGHCPAIAVPSAFWEKKAKRRGIREALLGMQGASMRAMVR